VRVAALVVDKLDGGALYRVDRIARFDQVVVDAGAAPAQLRDTGVDVVAPLSTVRAPSGSGRGRLGPTS
jgi:hypothetical protein